jgi:hypothetical protein
MFEFLRQLSLFDEQLSSKLIMQNDKLFMYMQVINIQLSSKQSRQKKRNFVYKGLTTSTNVFNIQNISLSELEKNNDKANKFIMRDILHTLQKEDKMCLTQNLFQIVSKRERQSLLNLAKTAFDTYFDLPELEDVDKLDF